MRGKSLKRRHIQNRGVAYNPVAVLKTKKEIEAIKMAARNNYRDLAYITLALNTGYRGGDILSMKVSDVLSDCTGKRVNIKRSIGRREQKTGWGSIRELGYTTRWILREFLLTRIPVDPDEPLFPSRQRDKSGDKKALSLDQINNILDKYAKTAELDKRVRSHTFRKTFGYFAYKQCNDISKVQALLNHTSSDITLRYIGISQDDLNSLTLNLNL
jgi:integrase